MAAAAPAIGQTSDDKPNMRDPKALTAKAPDTFKAKFETSAGAFVIQVNRSWAPLGADRFYNLVKSGFFDNVRFFRVVPNFMVQFGIHGVPSVATIWRNQQIKDDPVKQSNKRGYITFATAGPNTRTTQMFINFKDNAFLDSQGFAPFGQVTEGMGTVDKINAEYKETPNQGLIQSQGNAYLNKEFPRMDFVKKASIVN
jgi:peptidyl-prolyl cis-trans isomerase A (cyclophilin A)